MAPDRKPSELRSEDSPCGFNVEPVFSGGGKSWIRKRSWWLFGVVRLIAPEWQASGLGCDRQVSAKRPARSVRQSQADPGSCRHHLCRRVIEAHEHRDDATPVGLLRLRDLARQKLVRDCGVIAELMEDVPPSDPDFQAPPRSLGFTLPRLSGHLETFGDRWGEIAFRDHGRDFYIIIGVGKRASSSKVALVLRTLDALTISVAPLSVTGA